MISRAWLQIETEWLPEVASTLTRPIYTRHRMYLKICCRMGRKRSVQNINVMTRQRIAGDQGRSLIETLRERLMMII